MLNMEKLKKLTKEKGMSIRKLESAAGLGAGTITRWKTSNPSHENLRKVADVLGCSVSYLTGEADQKKGTRIPVLGRVPCGIPFDAIEFLDADDWEEIPEDMSSQGSFFGLRVSGNSMEPRIQEGDILIVRCQDSADSGDIVVARVNGQDACCKRYIRHESGIVLQSFNPAFLPLVFTWEDVERLPVAIIGVVVELRRKLH